MALLVDPAGRPIVLAARHLLGRSRAMSTAIPQADVSAEHAVIAWDGSRWTLRDLGSRNGTRLCGRALAPGISHPLALQDVVELGGAWQGVVATLTPPGPTADHGGHVVEGDGTLLAVPSAGDPRLLVFLDADGEWRARSEGPARPISDGDTVHLDGEPWRIHLPETLEATRERSPAGADVSGCHLAFAVSADDEYVEVTATVDGHRHAIPPRAHHYTWLTLARARLSDSGDEAERGWRYTDTLQAELGMSPNQLHVAFYRIRRDMKALGLGDANAMVERRATTRQVRVGVPSSSLAVSSLGR